METFATKALCYIILMSLSKKYNNDDPGWHMGIPTFLTLCGQNKWKKLATNTKLSI